VQRTEAAEEVDGRRSNFPAILEQWRQKERTASGSSTASGGSSGSTRSFDSDLVQPLTRSVMAISRVREAGRLVNVIATPRNYA
jgi:hypothetical protein